MAETILSPEKFSPEKTSPAEENKPTTEHEKTPPPEEYEIVHTVDGLPLEAKVLGLSGKRVKIRLASTQREMTVSLEAQNSAMQRRLLAQAEEERKHVETMPLRVTLVDNPTREKTKTFEQRIILENTTISAPGSNRTPPKIQPPGRTHAPAPPKNRLLLPGSRCLHIEIPSQHNVDVPLEGHVYWFARRTENAPPGVEFTERFSLLATARQNSHYYTHPPTFARPAYQGYAIIIFNRSNKTPLHKSASNNVFLTELDRRHNLPQAQTTKQQTILPPTQPTQAIQHPQP